MGRRLSLIISLVITGCALTLVCLFSFRDRSVSRGSEPSSRPNAQGSSDAGESKLVAANLEFGFKLFHELLKHDQGENMFISPLSVSIALAMTYNGASGDTKEAMAKTLELQGMSLEEINRAYAGLRATLVNPDSNVRLIIANSLWGRKGITFKREFIKINKDFYEAEVRALDFSGPGASETVNAWVRENTGGKIDNIIHGIDPRAILFLMSATYFEGTWDNTFDRALTKERQFTLLNGRRKKHPLMFRSGLCEYYRGKGFQAVILRYSGDTVPNPEGGYREENRASMYIFLPDRRSSLERFHKTLNAENWERWMPRFRMMHGDLYLPRFKFEYQVKLNEALKALGMEVAFDEKHANFDEMCSLKPVWISEGEHKTFVEVHEEGTVAAAGTSCILLVGKLDTFEMVVDRPFFFAIRDNETGIILFMGSVVDPQ